MLSQVRRSRAAPILALVILAWTGQASAQGVSGGPSSQSNVARSSAAWTSATSVDTTLSLKIVNFPSIGITVNTTSTITAGALIFEASDDGGTTWFQAHAIRIDAYSAATTYTLVASTKIAFVAHAAGGYTDFRVRLNPAITGSGTATVALVASAGAVMPDVTVGQATASDLNARIDASGATAAAVPGRAVFNGGSDGTNLVGYYVDPCQRGARTRFVIDQTSGEKLITGTSSKQTYICSMNLITATAQNIALVEGTGTVCATGTGVMAGGTTAGTGWNWSANGGMAHGDGVAWVFSTTTAADDVCLLQSGGGQVSGSGTYVQY